MSKWRGLRGLLWIVSGKVEVEVVKQDMTQLLLAEYKSLNMRLWMIQILVED